MGLNLKSTLICVAVGLAGIFGWNSYQYKSFKSVGENEVAKLTQMRQSIDGQINRMPPINDNSITNSEQRARYNFDVEVRTGLLRESYKIGLKLGAANNYKNNMENLSWFDMLFGYFKSPKDCGVQ